MAVRGSASIDTGRFKDKDKQFQKNLTFPDILKEKVNMKKIVFKSIKPWIKQEIDALLGFDDGVVVDFVYNLLDNPSIKYPDGKAITVKLMGFLEQDTMSFMEKLWTHLVDANNNKLGIPTKLLVDAKFKNKIKKEQKIQNIDRYQLKKEIEQNIKPYNSYYRGTRRNNYTNNNNNYTNRNRNSNRNRNYNNNYTDRNYNKVKEYEKIERNSMNSHWPPSPSPPAILKNIKISKSPSPPTQIKKELKSTTKSILKRHKHKTSKRRKNRSYSSSRSRSRSRSLSRRRSRSRSLSTKRRRSRSRSRSLSRSLSPRLRRRYYRSPSRSQSRSRSRGRWGEKHRK